MRQLSSLLLLLLQDPDEHYKYIEAAARTGQVSCDRLLTCCPSLIWRYLMDRPQHCL
jgi:hypothetical protein